MANNPILDLPLGQVMRPEIAMILQQVLQIYTVGNFLSAWRNPRNHKSIEQIFDSPQQARHAATVCATWLGASIPNTSHINGAWWPVDESTPGCLKTQ